MVSFGKWFGFIGFFLHNVYSARCGYLTEVLERLGGPTSILSGAFHTDFFGGNPQHWERRLGPS